MKKGLFIALLALFLDGCGDGTSNLDRAFDESTAALTSTNVAMALCTDPKVCVALKTAQTNLLASNDHLRQAKKDADDNDFPGWGIFLIIVLFGLFGV